MRRIPLTQGEFAIISDCDYKYLTQWKWCYHKCCKGRGGYAVRNNPNGGTIHMHGMVADRMGLKSDEIDHRHQDKLDNRRSKLRAATSSQNKGNCDKRRTKSTSKYKGVSELSQQYKSVSGRITTYYWWRADIGGLDTGCGHLHLGLFKHSKAGEIEAAFAYTVAAIKAFKKFASFIPVDHLLDSETKKRIKRDVLQRLAKRKLM